MLIWRVINKTACQQQEKQFKRLKAVKINLLITEQIKPCKAVK